MRGSTRRVLRQCWPPGDPELKSQRGHHSDQQRIRNRVSSGRRAQRQVRPRCIGTSSKGDGKAGSTRREHCQCWEFWYYIHSVPLGSHAQTQHTGFTFHRLPSPIGSSALPTMVHSLCRAPAFSPPTNTFQDGPLPRAFSGFRIAYSEYGTHSQSR